MARSLARNSWVLGRFSQLCPPPRRGRGPRRAGSRRCPMSIQNRTTSNIASCDGRVLEVEVGLVAEEAVPEELPPHRVEGPVRGLGVDEDDARVGVLRRRCRTTRRSRRTGPRGRTGDAWNHGCWSLVWFMTRSMMIRMPRACACVTSSVKSGSVPNSGSTARVVGDVVATVAQRRGVERRQPEAVDAEPLQVVEPVDQAGEVARAGARWSRRRRAPAPRRRRPSGTTAGRASGPAADRLSPCTQSLLTWTMCDGLGVGSEPDVHVLAPVPATAPVTRSCATKPSWQSRPERRHVEVHRRLAGAVRVEVDDDDDGVVAAVGQAARRLENAMTFSSSTWWKRDVAQPVQRRVRARGSR